MNPPIAKFGPEKGTNDHYIFNCQKYQQQRQVLERDMEKILLRKTITQIVIILKDQESINQVPHLTQDTNGKVTNSQLDTTNEGQEVSPFQAGDHKAHIKRRVQRHSKHKTEKHKRSTKEVPTWNGR